MPGTKSAGSFLPYLLLAIFFAVSVASRPLLPIDETRYLTVAWEMYLRQSFLVPTLNFEPYLQKPPLLFWLIDIAWSLFGVSRIAALAVIFAISCTVIHLTQRLAGSLFPDEPGVAERAPWLMLGSVAFIIYSSLVLFDLLLTVFVLAAFCALIAFCKGGRRRYVFLAGLFAGLGLISKGPVTFIHLASPIVLYPLWRDPRSSIVPREFYAGLPLAVLACLVPPALWLGPAVYHEGFGFAYDLVWRQAAGRISGALESAHKRPVYFYVLLLPLALLPWGLSPDLWRSWRRLRDGGLDGQDRRVLRFLVLWIGLVVIVFSLIAGKQPHYLVPLLPPVVLVFALLMAEIRLAVLRNTAAAMLALFAAGQVIASVTFFPRYDLQRVAEFVAGRSDADWAYSGRYQGQLTFLARASKPFAIVAESEADEWLDAHPSGYLITNANHYPDSSARVVFSQLGDKGYLIVLRGAQAREG